MSIIDIKNGSFEYCPNPDSLPEPLRTEYLEAWGGFVKDMDERFYDILFKLEKNMHE